PEQLGTPDLLVLPGSKSTLSDLEWLRQSGLAEPIMRLAEGGTPIIGICGGYQMMGKTIYDPEHVESPESQADGLGLLPVITIFTGTKATHRVAGRVSVGAARGLLAGAETTVLRGYEIHMGISNVEGESAFRLSRHREAGDHPDGALSEDGLRLGTYVHGLFENATIRQSVLRAAHIRSGREGAQLPPPGPSWSRQASYDMLADMLGEHLDMDRLWKIVGLERVTG
ncbi:MAG: cobyric acid synthase CobQ, partial [Chloroflexota bacterium]|nr:cobyric acid synthase CobQ [Chloroflexota bacterium]